MTTSIPTGPTVGSTLYLGRHFQMERTQRGKPVRSMKGNRPSISLDHPLHPPLFSCSTVSLETMVSNCQQVNLLPTWRSKDLPVSTDLRLGACRVVLMSSATKSYLLEYRRNIWSGYTYNTPTRRGPCYTSRRCTCSWRAHIERASWISSRTHSTFSWSPVSSASRSSDTIALC